MQGENYRVLYMPLKGSSEAATNIYDFSYTLLLSANAARVS